MTKGDADSSNLWKTMENVQRELVQVKMELEQERKMKKKGKEEREESNGRILQLESTVKRLVAASRDDLLMFDRREAATCAEKVMASINLSSQDEKTRREAEGIVTLGDFCRFVRSHPDCIDERALP